MEVEVLDAEVGRVESLHMPYLQLDVGFLDKFYEFAGLIHGVGKGLLHEYVLTPTDGALAKIKMEGGGSYDVDNIDGIHEAFGVEETGDLVFIRYYLGSIVVGVIKAHHFNVPDLFPVVEVKFPEVPNAEQANL
jgi:hypothetical protein